MANDGKTIHPFEKAGFGKAPFRYVGMSVEKYQACHGAPIQPGTSCDYCSQGIMNVCHIVSSDGFRFKVGCDCVRKVSHKGERLLTDFERAYRKSQNEARHASQDAKINAALARMPGNRHLFEALPHPSIDRLTLADWVDWMLDHSGRAGKVKVATMINKVLDSK
jgi:hypothetical protein